MTKISALLKKSTGVLFAAACIFSQQSFAQTFCNNQTGTDDGFFYSHWSNGRGSACISLGNDGKYSYNWDNVGNHVGGKGWRPGKIDRVIGYKADRYSVSGGRSLLALYGWTKSPLIEYYVVDNWAGNRPTKGTSLGRVETDGGTYDIYRSQRVNKPSIEGTKTFYQYWSVRTSKRELGQNHRITFQNHANAWNSRGLNLGNHFYQIMATEGLRDSSGQSDITVWDAGVSTPAPTPTPQPGGYSGRVNLPGRVEAENYAAAPSESTPGNRNARAISQCSYYGLDVDVQDASEGTCNVGWTTAGEALEYKIGAAGGVFDLNVRLASRDAGKRVRVLVNGSIAGTVVANGGGWDAWNTKTISAVNVPSNATVRVIFLDGAVNLNYLQFLRAPNATPGPTPTQTPTPSPSATPVTTPVPTLPPTSPGCQKVINIVWNTRTEITVDNATCIRFDRSLSGRSLQIWDSDANTSCDYRGTIAAVDGSGSVAVNRNYVISTALSGTTFRFSGAACPYVKVRAF